MNRKNRQIKSWRASGFPKGLPLVSGIDKGPDKRPACHLTDLRNWWRITRLIESTNTTIKN